MKLLQVFAKHYNLFNQVPQLWNLQTTLKLMMLSILFHQEGELSISWRRGGDYLIVVSQYPEGASKKPGEELFPLKESRGNFDIFIVFAGCPVAREGMMDLTACSQKAN